MSLLIMSDEIKKLRVYSDLRRKFGLALYRQIDRFITIKRGGRWLLVNSFFPRYVLETYDKRTLALLNLFSEPLSFVLFLKRLSYKFHLKYSSKSKKDIRKISLLLSTVETLLKYKYIVGQDFNEYAVLARMRQYLMKMSLFPNCAYIITSLDCNFRCPGCFIYRGEWKRKRDRMMTPETFDLLHSFVIKMIPKTVNMEFIYTFYGGEPLLNKAMIEYASRTIRRLKKKGAYGKLRPKLVIVTNGSLIDDDIIRIIKRYDIHMAVSLDGVGFSHDVNRVFPGGIGTFKAVLKGVRQLEKAGIQYNLSWTIAPGNIDSVARDVKWVANNLRTRAICFNVMQDITGTQFKKIDKKSFFKKMHHIYDVLRENNIEEKRLQRYRLSKRKSWELLPYPFYCSAVGGGQFEMRPDGKIGICHAGLMQKEDQWQTPGQISNIYRDPVYSQWYLRTPIFIKKCYQGCDYLSLCPGGCAYRVNKITGSLYDICDDVCTVERFFMERAIIEDFWKDTD